VVGRRERHAVGAVAHNAAKVREVRRLKHHLNTLETRVKVERNTVYKYFLCHSTLELCVKVRQGELNVKVIGGRVRLLRNVKLIHHNTFPNVLVCM